MAQRRGEQMGNQMSASVGDKEGWLVGFGRELKGGNMRDKETESVLKRFANLLVLGVLM